MDDAKNLLQGGKPIEPSSSIPLLEPQIQLQSCSTEHNGCAGLARWQNQSGQTISGRVWFRNGDAGNSNFVLAPGQGHELHVRTGDTQSWEWGNVQVPPSNPRSWINVG